MRHYLLSIQQLDGGPLAPELLEPIMREVAAFDEELKAAGAWVFAGGLHDAGAAAVVRPGNGESLVTDGPYVEGKEHVGGLSIIKAPDLESALEWGRKLARATTLPIEVREFQGEPDDHLK
ncbi:YciI family protein [Nonomuraea sp. NPDC049784]|uniref:YciI family protein n=1 Tax=Nonomuraea sp. NPDC049784 TaxID=3154361 RepID=UPI00340E1743